MVGERRERKENKAKFLHEFTSSEGKQSRQWLINKAFKSKQSDSENSALTFIKKLVYISARPSLFVEGRSDLKTL